MYLFLLLSLPLGFLLLFMSRYPAGEKQASLRPFLRGLAISPLAWIIARFLGGLLPDFFGSPLLVLAEWMDRSLPYAGLPLLGYACFYRFNETLPAGAAERRILAFTAGCLLPLGAAEAARSWHSPDLHLAILLPVICGSMAFVAGPAVLGIAGQYGFRRILGIAALIVASLAAATPRWLILSGLWPLAVLVTAALATGAWLYAAPRTVRQPPAPLET